MTTGPMTPKAILAMTRGYPARVWLVCFGAYALSQMDLAMWSYALPLIRAEFELSRTQLGLVTGIAFAGGGLLLVWLGVLTDRFGRRRMMIFATVASSIFVTAHAFAINVVMLTILRGASIATGGLLYPATGALVAEEAPSRIRGIMTGLLQVGYPLGWFLASLIAIVTLERFGWRAMFIAGLLSVPFIFVIRRVIQESRRFVTDRAVKRPLKSGIRELFLPGVRKRTLTLFIAQYCFVIAYGGAFIFSPLYFNEARGFSIAGTATLVGLSNLIGILGYLVAAWVGEFVLSRRTTTIIWTLLGSVFFTIFIWGSSTYWGSMVAFSTMALFLLGTAAVKFAYVAELFPTRLRATGLAFCGSLAVTLGSATGPIFIGWMADNYTWDIAMFLGGAVPLLVAGLLYLLLKPVPSGLDIDEVERRLA
ncbi:MAG: MFS transporter [Gammaproteobacteria bacterium]|nr:MAG: MFS transporter [Gammaproteobacteria bacterium]